MPHKRSLETVVINYTGSTRHFARELGNSLRDRFSEGIIDRYSFGEESLSRYLSVRLILDGSEDISPIPGEVYITIKELSEMESVDPNVDFNVGVGTERQIAKAEKFYDFEGVYLGEATDYFLRILEMNIISWLAFYESRISKLSDEVERESAIYELGDVQCLVDGKTLKSKILIKNEEVKFNQQERDLLEILIKKANNLVLYNEITEKLFGDPEVDEIYMNRVRNLIARVNKKIRAHTFAVSIENQSGVGYLLELKNK